MARPKKEIDLAEFADLCKLQCTKDEICFFFQIDEKTLTRICEDEFGKSFSDYYKEASQGGKISLRRMQYKVAMKGSVPLLIWLGKQWLGQSDKLEHTGDEKKPVMLSYPQPKAEP